MTTPFDTALRHQAYIEGVKAYHEESFDPTNEALAILLAAMLGKWGYDNIGDMPKRELRRFISEFNRRADKLLKPFDEGFLEDLRKLAEVDVIILFKNAQHATGKNPAKPARGALFDKFKNEYAGATGMSPAAMLKAFLTSTKNKLLGLVKRAYSDKMTMAEVMAQLRGTKAASFKDGLLRKIINEWNTTQRTLLQSLHQSLNHGIGRLFYSHYQWVAVLDSVTTEICRGRNGNVYAYGKGPLPPAHWNCRSTIVGLPGVEAYPTPTYHEWAKGQSPAVQRDIIGSAAAKLMQAGKSRATDLPQFRNRNKINPANLAKLQPRMVQ